MPISWATPLRSIHPAAKRWRPMVVLRRRGWAMDKAVSIRSRVRARKRARTCRDHGLAAGYPDVGPTISITGTAGRVPRGYNLDRDHEHGDSGTARVGPGGGSGRGGQQPDLDRGGG